MLLTPHTVPAGRLAAGTHSGLPEAHDTRPSPHAAPSIWPRWQLLVTRHDAPLRHIVGVSLGTQLN